MPTPTGPRIHCVTAFAPPSTDKRLKLHAKRLLVVATDRDEAMRKAATHCATEEGREGGAMRLRYRNEWSAGDAVTWDFIYPERSAYPDEAPTAADLADPAAVALHEMLLFLGGAFEFDESERGRAMHAQAKKLQKAYLAAAGLDGDGEE